jgi:hypothetical protein
VVHESFLFDSKYLTFVESLPTVSLLIVQTKLWINGRVDEGEADKMHLEHFELQLQMQTQQSRLRLRATI